MHTFYAVIAWFIVVAASVVWGVESLAAVLGVAGLVTIAIATTMAALDAFRFICRPTMKLADQGLLLRAGFASGIPPVLGAVGLVLVVASGIEGGWLLDVASSRRGGPVLLAPVVAPPLLFATFVVLVRRDGVLIGRDRLRVWRLGRRRDVMWDDLLGVTVVPDDPRGLVRLDRRGSLRAGSARPGSIILRTAHLHRLPVAVRNLVEHYRVHPGERYELGTPVALDLLAVLESEVGVARVEQTTIPPWRPWPVRGRPAPRRKAARRR